MNMKKMMMTMLALLCMTVASAQQTETNSRQPRQFDATTQTTRMTEKLGLSSEQQTKVEALNKEYAELFTRPQMRSAMQGGSSNGERPTLTDEQKAQMKASMEARRTKRGEYTTKLKSILTDAQYQTYQKEMQGHRGHRGGGPRGQKDSE